MTAQSRHQVPPGARVGLVTLTPGRALIALFKELSGHGVLVADITLTRLQGRLTLVDGLVVAYRCGWLIWPAGRASRRGRPLQTLHSALDTAGAARRLSQPASAARPVGQGHYSALPRAGAGVR